MIRHALSSDLLAMVPVARKFFVEGKLPMALKEDIWVANWSKFIDSGVGLVLMSEQDSQPTGAIGGLVINDPNDGELMLSEMFWYVDPTKRGDGLRLLNAFEMWAATHNVKRITMIHLEHLNSRLGELYERRGYRKLESHYIKEL